MGNEWRIGLVGCVAGKGSTAAPAKDLYTSPLFVGRRRWVERTCGRWFILSAKHGLVLPDELLEPYDRSLNDVSAEELRTWAEACFDEIERRLGELSRYHFEFHAGAAYQGELRSRLERAGASTSYPMQGRNLGQQLACYERGPAGTCDDSEGARAATAHVDRARDVARRLMAAWADRDLLGPVEMPESTLPAGVARGSVEHANFITLTVAIDYQRTAADLWRAARVTYDDESTRWVFSPAAVANAPAENVRQALSRHGLLKGARDGGTWRTIATSLHERFGGDPRRLAATCGHNATRILSLLRQGGFPYLQGPKIGPLWIRMLVDEVEVELADLDRIPIPVDVQITRVTWATGALAGRYSGTVDDCRDMTADVWRRACADQAFSPLQLDAPMWLQGQRGCSHRPPVGPCPHTAQCVLSDLCVDGRLTFAGGRIEAETGSAPPEAGDGDLWQRIVRHAGELGFRTARGDEVVYSVDGTAAVVVRDRKGARLSRESLEAVFASGPVRTLADVPADVWGRSYVYAILRDPRIAAENAS